MWIMWIMCAFSPRSLPCAVALWHCQCGILRARMFNYIFIVMADSAAMDWEQLLQMSCKFLSEWYQLAISNTSPLSACHPSAFFSIAVLSLVRTFPQKSCAWLHAMPSMRAGFDQCVHLFGRESHHQWSARFSSQNFSSEIHTASVAPQLKHVLSLLSTGIFSSRTPWLQTWTNLRTFWKLQVSRCEFWKRQRFIIWCAGTKLRDADGLWVCGFRVFRALKA